VKVKGWLGTGVEDAEGDPIMAEADSGSGIAGAALEDSDEEA
jgi:hypothetical protein